MSDDDLLDQDELTLLNKNDQIRQDELREKRNLRVVYFVNFCSNICFSLITPLIWSYLQNFQISSLGYSLIVAAFPAGSACGSLIWGYWSKWAYRRPLILSLALTLFFTLT
jgi:MFS family permease